VSIIKMQRIAVIGLDTQRDELMSRLMDFGAVQLTDQSSKLEDQIWREAVVKDENQEAVSLLEGRVNRAEAALEILEKYGSGRKPLFSTRRKITPDRVREEALQLAQAEEKVSTVLSLNEKLQRTAEQINRTETDRVSLLPWTAYDLPLETERTKECSIRMGVMPQTADPEETGRSLEESFGSVLFRVAGSDKDLHYVILLTTSDTEEEAAAFLKQKGWNEISFRGFTGTVEENLARLAEEAEGLRAEYASIEKEIGALADRKDFRQSIEVYADLTSVEADRQRIRSRLLKTQRTFFIEGWIPEKCIEEATAILEENECYYMFRRPEEGEEVPVALANPDMVVPFEAVTEMYSLPAYSGFDPTRIYAIFYAIFFGMMLSDAGYGILMAAGCFIILKKFDLEGTMYKMIRLFFYCGISTTLWGALFGGWFGDIVPVFTRTILGREVTIEPLWFNPIEDPMKLLTFSLVLGVVHLFVGMGIKAYMQIKEGKWFDAVCDEGFWYVTIIGLAGWLFGGSLAPGIAGIARWMAIAGIAGLLLTGGRHNKGLGKITGGLGNVYNITSYLSDILSYARILALGLATGVIAQVVNTMGAMGGDGVFGFLMLLVVFVVGHTLNLVINVLGAFIHTSRLQYIEFFGKFYEDGGEAFDPFRRKTKYIKIETEE